MDTIVPFVCVARHREAHDAPANVAEMPPKVAIVSRDPAVRDAAARAFSAAPAEWSVTLCETPPRDADVVVSDREGGGAIVFDPSRPADALEEVGARIGGGRVYVVAAAAGGTGATTVALHVTAALTGRACYAELAGASTRLGLPEDALTWKDDPASSALPVGGGFRVLRAPGPCPDVTEFPLDAARAAFDRLVLDAGTRRDLGDLVETATVAVAVTTPTRPAALATRELVEAWPDVRWAVVVNRLGAGGQIMRAGLEALLGCRVAVELPCCPAVRDAEDEARLVTGSWRRWSRGIARLVRALESC